MKTQSVLLLSAIALFIPGLATNASAQSADLSFLTTAAERTDFQETTRYDEVMAFLRVASAQHPDMHLTHFGYSLEGRPLPLVVFGDVNGAEPEDVLDSGKTRIFIQGNIHAGEVCGKEALLMLTRALASGEHAAWADSLVILMAPIYNADGNERVNLFNRPRQNGPLGGMGQRPNAQGLDLNRDHMKMKSPEARSLINLMNKYDPHVLVDLHTTNGTRHGYHLTYSPALNPNTATAIDSLSREVILPEVTRDFKRRSGWEAYYYGNLPFRSGDPGWYTFDHRPRFNNNYIGLRNRIPILSEAYAYATFEERILSSLYFVESILSWSHGNPGAIHSAINQAEANTRTGLEQGVRFTRAMNEAAVDILMGTVETKTNPFSGAPYLNRTDSVYVTRIPEFGAFRAVESAMLPEGWVVDSASASTVAPILDAHGIAYSVVSDDMDKTVSTFQIDSLDVASRAFQQINEQELHGSWMMAQRSFTAGSLIVPVDNELGRLSHYLLEPRSDDGLVNWALIPDLDQATTYPIHRIESDD